MGDDAVGQSQRRVGRTKGPHKDGGRGPVWPDVAHDGRVEDIHHAIGVKDGTAVPAQGLVAAERAVFDGGVAQHADAATRVSGLVAADRAPGNVGRGALEAIEATTVLLCRVVVADGAVDQA